ncbi:hypothetical protein L1987_13769 [Smallanthus sonchifolius]|uniref:Uncharacterized protein n=1 Tax=Smallanthus sonchifolius TaxID=185202 RepID=A0ACB9JJP3_9ASTR|nr:hypothetical protein L1987_13769 [Smallanthus sonchifolius]
MILHQRRHVVECQDHVDRNIRSASSSSSRHRSGEDVVVDHIYLTFTTVSSSNSWNVVIIQKKLHRSCHQSVPLLLRLPGNLMRSLATARLLVRLIA